MKNPLTITRSSSVIITFAIKRPKGNPIGTPLNCSYNFLLKEKAVLVHASYHNFLSDLLLSVVECLFSFYTLFKMISIVFFSGTFVNNGSNSRDAKVYPSLISPNDIKFILAAASKQSWTTYSFCANGFHNHVKNFPILWLSVPIVSVVRRNLGRYSNGLWILGKLWALAVFAALATISLNIYVNLYWKTSAKNSQNKKRTL